MFDIYADIIKTIRDMTQFEAQAKIRRHQLRDDAMARATRAHQAAVCNKYNAQRNQTKNRQMTLWRIRNRTCR